jgi:hypothetical protein
MFTRDDLIDFLVSRLTSERGAAASFSTPLSGKCYPNTMLPKGRIFLTEHEIKKRLTTSGLHLTIPKDAIISPLASDWLILNGIKVSQE